MPLLLALQELLGKADGAWRKKNVSLYHFLADRKIPSMWKKMHFLASYSMGNKFLLVARHTLTTGLQKCL